MFLQPGTQAVSITDLSEVWLIVDVFERDMSRLKEDMAAVARFEHLPVRSFEGTIDYIYPELDPRTRTLPVRLRFDNSEGLLRPGMFGSVSLVPQESRQVLTIPSEAVIRTGAADRVILKTGPEPTSIGPVRAFWNTSARSTGSLVLWSPFCLSD